MAPRSPPAPGPGLAGLAACWLIGCPDVGSGASTCELPRTAYADLDGDGFGVPANPEPTCTLGAEEVWVGGDCDDGDPAAFPGAAELDDTEACMADADGDGYGDVAAEGHVAAGTDCHDGAAGASPGNSQEDCGTAYDDDCDDNRNEVDAIGCTKFYLDNDGDGYGQSAEPQCTCAAISDYDTTTGGDCDDADEYVNPGREEQVGDGEDEDCDGRVLCFADGDDDGYLGPTGDTLVSQDADCTDAFEGTNTDPDTDCDDDNPDMSPGNTETCGDAVDNDCDDIVDDCVSATFVGDSTDSYAGEALSSAGDFNGDGWPDLLIGARGAADGSGQYPGAGYLVLGPMGGGTMNLEDIAVKFRGQAAGDLAGASVAGPGDLDGDGLADLAIGSPSRDLSGGGEGAAYVILGHPSPEGMELGDADAILEGSDSGDYAGDAVGGAGDVNGDGLSDLVVGAYQHDHDGRGRAGAAYLVLGAAVLPSAELADAPTKFIGDFEGDDFGSAVSAAGDVDGDGLGDIVIGAPNRDLGADDAGAAYLFLGDNLAAEVRAGNADATYLGEGEDDSAGYAVATAGDANGDGLGDVLVGAPRAISGGRRRGAAYLVLGRLAPSDLVLGSADATFGGDEYEDYAGAAVSSAGDVNGDGLDDALVGAPNNEMGGWSAGASYVVHGAVTPVDVELDASTIIHGGEEGEGAGEALSPAGDTDADGLHDVLIGASVHSETFEYDGAAYLVLGNSL